MMHVFYGACVVIVGGDDGEALKNRRNGEVSLCSVATERKFMSQAWLVRCGRVGERESWAIENSVAGGGFLEVSSLTDCDSKEDVRLLIEKCLPAAKPK